MNLALLKRRSEQLVLSATSFPPDLAHDRVPWLLARFVGTSPNLTGRLRGFLFPHGFLFSCTSPHNREGGFSYFTSASGLSRPHGFPFSRTSPHSSEGGFHFLPQPRAILPHATDMLHARRTTGAFIFFPMDATLDTLQPFSSNIYCHFFGGFFLFSLPCGFLFFPALQQHLFNNRLATRFNSLGNTCLDRSGAW